jgi:hypothetical protein
MLGDVEPVSKLAKPQNGPEDSYEVRLSGEVGFSYGEGKAVTCHRSP